MALNLTYDDDRFRNLPNSLGWPAYISEGGEEKVNRTRQSVGEGTSADVKRSQTRNVHVHSAYAPERPEQNALTGSVVRRSPEGVNTQDDFTRRWTARWRSRMRP